MLVLGVCVNIVRDTRWDPCSTVGKITIFVRESGLKTTTRQHLYFFKDGSKRFSADSSGDTTFVIKHIHIPRNGIWPPVPACNVNHRNGNLPISLFVPTISSHSSPQVYVKLMRLYFRLATQINLMNVTCWVTVQKKFCTVYIDGCLTCDHVTAKEKTRKFWYSGSCCLASV